MTTNSSLVKKVMIAFVKLIENFKTAWGTFKKGNPLFWALAGAMRG